MYLIVKMADKEGRKLIEAVKGKYDGVTWNHHLASLFAENGIQAQVKWAGQHTFDPTCDGAVSESYIPLPSDLKVRSISEFT